MKIAMLGKAVLLAMIFAWMNLASAADQAASPDASAAKAPVVNEQFKIEPVSDEWRHSLPRDADAATKAYMDRLSPAIVARANAYFEGGYWLQLWNFLLGLIISYVLLMGKRCAQVRDWSQRIGRKAFFRDALFGAFYSVASFILALPLTIYQGFFREHAYGMATQTFVPWFIEQLINLVVSTLLMALGVAVLYAVMRRVGKSWWVWGTGVAVAMLIFVLMIAPIWIDPLTNTYKPVEDGPVKSAVLAMAKADGVPADNVYVFDASRQTTRVSANVSGILGSASVRLNDNLMRCTLPEIRAVMGHELGHYVMNHIYKFIAEFALLMMAGFLFSQWAMNKLQEKYGAQFGLQGVSDVASLPILAAVLSLFLFVATPFMNTMVRTQEIEADRFGLNLAREPHGASEAFLKLTEYRKPDPGPIEEFIFFDHPSTRFRVHDAMRWREAMGTP